MGIEPQRIIGVSWIIFILFWVVSSFWAKRNRTREANRGALRRLLLIVVAYLLISRASDPRLGVLSRHFLPPALWLVWLGAVFTMGGVAFAIWARIHIGRYWSSSVALKQGHKLIRTGPYARIRHPIYTGILVAVAATCIAVDRWLALLGLAIIAAAITAKARKEEALLAGEFGPGFEDHRRSTGFFLPRIFGMGE